LYKEEKLIQFINQYPKDKVFSFDERIALLRKRKIEQTEEKSRHGGMDEDDYGLIYQEEFSFNIKPNKSNGGMYGYEGWSENYLELLKQHPLYVDPLDAFVGKCFLFMERLRRPDIKWNPDYPYPELAPLFEKYGIIHGIGQIHHFTPDLDIGLTKGWGGILKELEGQKKLHDASHKRFYDTEISVVKGIIEFLRRCASELKDLSKNEKNDQLSKNLTEMSELNERISADPPKTFKEAVQWIYWFSMLSRLYNRGSAGGQLDEMLRPYYERDKAAGILNDDEVVFYLACLFLQDSRYFQLGGPDKNGNDMISHISYLILDAAEKINVACNLTIRVHEKLDPVFFKKSVGALFRCRQGWPRYSSDTALTTGFMRNGYPEGLARKRVAAGCHWMCIPGMEYTLNDCIKINMAKVFEEAFRTMMKGKEQNIESLFNHFSYHLEQAVNATGAGIIHHLKHQEESTPELILNLFQDGLIERGVDITNGGANLYDMCVDGSGMAVVADSLAACEQRIDREKYLTYEELNTYLENDYEGIEGERIRQLLQHSERFGGGNTRGDFWAQKINVLYTKLIRSLCDRYKNLEKYKGIYNLGIQFIPGYFSWSNTIMLGKMVGATPNGRKKGDVINHGVNPLPGFRKDGAVTSMCNSIAAIQPGYGNTAPIQLELDPGIADSEVGIKKMADMIWSICTTGNTLLNINIIDAKKILEADKDPLKYPDLVVRVTGFTAFFAMLSPEFRQLVVDRVKAVNTRELAEEFPEAI
jgi:formate C-acetyltransferase